MPYTLRAAAKALGVSVTTVQKWLEDGDLFEVPITGGVRAVSDESVQRKAKERGVELIALTADGDPA